MARLEDSGWTCSAREQPIQPAWIRVRRAEPSLRPRPPRPCRSRGRSRPHCRRPPLPLHCRRHPPPRHNRPRQSSRRRQRSLGRPGDDIITPSSAARLNRVVEQTLRSVQELYGGEFQAELAAFGDLDGDRLDDAAVLITYQADRTEYVQYLVAYLFNGETFQSVATKTSAAASSMRAELQGIAHGRIVIELEALDGGATCCALRQTAFALDNGQLIEVDDPDAPGPERTTEAAPG